MDLSSSIAEAIVLSHDILKFSNFQIYNNNDVVYSDKLRLSKLDIESLSVYIRNYLRKVTKNPLIEITYKKIKFPNDSIHGIGILKKNSDSNDIVIYINESLNHCKTRFAMCKELIQAYLDCGEFNFDRAIYSPIDIIPQIKEANECQRKLNNPQQNGDFSFPIGFNTEALSFVISGDLFFPVSDKKMIKLIGEKLIDATHTLTNYDLSYIYKCPEYMTEMYRESVEKVAMEYFSIHEACEYCKYDKG